MKYSASCCVSCVKVKQINSVCPYFIFQKSYFKVTIVNYSSNYKLLYLIRRFNWFWNNYIKNWKNYSCITFFFKSNYSNFLPGKCRKWRIECRKWRKKCRNYIKSISIFSIASVPSAETVNRKCRIQNLSLFFKVPKRLDTMENIDDQNYNNENRFKFY